MATLYSCYLLDRDLGHAACSTLADPILIFQLVGRVGLAEPLLLSDLVSVVWLVYLFGLAGWDRCLLEERGNNVEKQCPSVDLSLAFEWVA